MSFYLEDLVIGSEVEYGAFTFTVEDIVRFARAHDPQPFHLDEEEGRKSHFGGLVASGWHTAALWMKFYVSDRQHREAAAKAAGLPIALHGPSPGFRDLKWLRPVRPGDTLRYFGRITATRPSSSRPEWGLVEQFNGADNQHGERVLEFVSVAFLERRPKA
jgi:acyl dehydratase